MPFRPNLRVLLIVDRLKERLQISEAIGPKSLNNLVRLGLSKRFPEECDVWVKEINAIRLASQKDMEARQKKAQDQLSEARAQTESSIRFAVVNAVFSRYPFATISLSGGPLTNKLIVRLIVADASPLFRLSPPMKNRD